MLTTESTVVIAEQNVLSSTIENEVILLDLKQGQYYSLDAVGADVWHMLDQPTVVFDIIARIRDDYDAPAEQVEADVLLLLQDLEHEGLIEAQGATQAAAQLSEIVTQPSRPRTPSQQEQGKRPTLLSRLLKPRRRGKSE
jgi:hypothetical protein